MVAKEEEGTKVVFTEEDQALLDILRRKQKAADDTSFMSKGNIATYAYLIQPQVLATQILLPLHQNG